MVLTTHGICWALLNFLGVLNENWIRCSIVSKIVQRFDLEPKPGVAHLSRLEELTAVPSNDGDLALFEFTGALAPCQNLFLLAGQHQ